MGIDNNSRQIEQFERIVELLEFIEGQTEEYVDLLRDEKDEDLCPDPADYYESTIDPRC